MWHTRKEKVFLNQRIATETGNTESKYRLRINNFAINLNKPLSNFQKYDTINEVRQFALFSNFYLPIIMEKTTNIEYRYTDVVFTAEEAIRMTVERITNALLEGIENEENIVNKQINIYEGLGYVEVEVIIEVLEHIGVPKKI